MQPTEEYTQLMYILSCLDPGNHTDGRQQGYRTFTSGKVRAHEKVEYLFMGGLSLDDATHSRGGRGVPVGSQPIGTREGRGFGEKGKVGWRAGGLSELVVKGGGVHTLEHHHIIPTHQAPFGDLFIRLV